jgi:hypothetical protein
MYIDSSSYPLVRMGYERDKAQPWTACWRISRLC